MSSSQQTSECLMFEKQRTCSSNIQFDAMLFDKDIALEPIDIDDQIMTETLILSHVPSFKNNNDIIYELKDPFISTISETNEITKLIVISSTCESTIYY